MTREWTMTGDYVEACNCDVACQCIWMEAPDDGACTASLAWHIEDGRYGDVDLSGLHAAMLVRTEEGVMFAPGTGWDVVILLDDAADEDQRAALEDIFTGRAGGIFGAATDAHVERTEVATAPFSFSREGTEFSVEIGDVVSVAAVGKGGFNGKLGTISPHPLTANGEMNTGETTAATVSYDDEFAWDVSENNSFLGDFELANA